MLGFRLSRAQAAQAIIANARSVMLVADSTKMRAAPGPYRRHQRSRLSSPTPPLRAGLANICHTRGIPVIEAMPKADEDGDVSGTVSTVTPIRAPQGRGVERKYSGNVHRRVGNAESILSVYSVGERS